MGNTTSCCASRKEEQGGALSNSDNSQSLHNVIEDTRQGTECNISQDENKSNTQKTNRRKKKEKQFKTTIKPALSLKNKKSKKRRSKDENSNNLSSPKPIEQIFANKNRYVPCYTESQSFSSIGLNSSDDVTKQFIVDMKNAKTKRTSLKLVPSKSYQKMKSLNKNYGDVGFQNYIKFCHSLKNSKANRSKITITNHSF
ncbi:unnamed protein product [Moneuplotes crassus]|uniref:Uncharacterized protein n=1 Tax=Euplotes crassus TaxID=5936 RepID=A0AAD1XSQ0_EUPCR|nr:unnamed protein product [Moneuplotes crassus]